MRTLKWIEKTGNALPDPITIFLLLTTFVVLLSALFDGVSESVVQRTGETELKSVQSLLSFAGIRWMFTSAIDNFINFAPLGPVLTVMIGIGVAERTGFISMGLRSLVSSVPKSFITAALVFAGVMSSMVADAGYIVLTPLGAMLFAGIGRHPLAGLAASYAGVSGGYSANFFITGLDPLLARLTDQAAKTIDPSYTVNALSNYYFMVASVILITIVGTLVSNKIVEPMLGEWDSSQGEDESSTINEITNKEKKAFLKSIFVGIGVAVAIALLAIIPGSPLRDAVGEGEPAISALNTFFGTIEVLVCLLFIIPGICYGVLTKKIKNDKDVAKMASDSMASMGAYIVLAFIAGQFVAYFNWTNMGAITAVKGANLLQTMGLTGTPLLISFLIVAAMMNMFMGSASAKWAFMAPIFVPMLMLVGFSPELTQVTYRVGDSVTNIITPLMPYLPIIIVFAQKYDRKSGLGTIISAMFPYSVAFFFSWTIMLVIWFLIGIPLGPGAATTL
ncbi:MAG: aminobenzoyl-glutamate transporter [Halobacteriovoraceae bacterium]|nr:aminobenzoyl-glutamate transporter [Halobacteriovoraceae bacterium]